MPAIVAAVRGVETPRVPPDRTHVFHKHRVRLDPERAGLQLAPAARRDRVFEGLRSNGVEAVSRPTAPRPLFASTERYPNAESALESTLIIELQAYPLFAQPLEVVDAWADGFETAWNHSPS
jgi:dTDP-4-amino-4,6-dideoxygalactose transaminase